MAGKSGMILSAMMVVAACCASLAHGQAPPEPVQGLLSEALVELAQSPDNLLVGSPGLLVVEEVNLDINTDGLLDASDIDAWNDDLVVQEMNDDLEILSYAYALRKDVNRDGKVNALDRSLLRNGIADKIAELGGFLVWQGEVVHPGTTPVYFDGVSVVSELGSQLAVAELQIDEDGDEECPSELINDTGYSALGACVPCNWDQAWLACGEIVLFEGNILICPGAYGEQCKVKQCGETGPIPISLCPKNTTHSTVPTVIGSRIDQIRDFGITWAADQKVEVKAAESFGVSGEANRHKKLCQRYCKYTVTYSFRPQSAPSCPGDTLVGGDTIHTTSSDQRVILRTCPGCPE